MRLASILFALLAVTACGPILVTASRPSVSPLPLAPLGITYALDLVNIPDDTFCTRGGDLRAICVHRLRSAIESGLRGTLEPMLTYRPEAPDWTVSFHIVEFAHRTIGERSNIDEIWIRAAIEFRGPTGVTWTYGGWARRQSTGRQQIEYATDAAPAVANVLDNVFNIIGGEIARHDVQDLLASGLTVAAPSRVAPSTAESQSASPAPGVPGIATSTWAFCSRAPNPETVTFRSNGRAVFAEVPPRRLGPRWVISMRPRNVSWSQDGDRVVLDFNHVTIFELHIDGDTMIGEWHRAAHPNERARTCLRRTEVHAPPGGLPGVASGSAPVDPSLPETPTRVYLGPTLSALRDHVLACTTDPAVGLWVSLVFRADGGVSSASACGASGTGTPITESVRACVATVALTARVPAFSRPTFSVLFPYGPANGDAAQHACASAAPEIADMSFSASP